MWNYGYSLGSPPDDSNPATKVQPDHLPAACGIAMTHKMTHVE